MSSGVHDKTVLLKSHEGHLIAERGNK